MTLWVLLTIMCSAAAVLAAVPLIRRFESKVGYDAADTGIYRDQLTEIERDRRLGLIEQGAADLARTEIQRRLLASVKSIEATHPISSRWRNVALVAVTAFVVLGAVSLYAQNGRPDLQTAQSAAEATIGSPAIDIKALASATAPSAVDSVDGMIAKLAARLRDNPGDAEGWRMLGWSYFNTQHYDEAVQAYARAVAIEPRNMDYKSAHAEAIVQSAGGIVMPAAQGLFEEVLQQDPKEARSRFYMALAREQAGSLDVALDMWIALLADAPKDAGWVDDVKQRIAELGTKTGRKAESTPSAGSAKAAKNGPVIVTADQRAAVDAMIAKLAAKLENDPMDRDGWAMMIRSLSVKGDAAGAQRALARALAVFANDPSTRTQIAAMAKSLGVQASESEPAAASVVNTGDAAAISALPEGDQLAMIRGMVDRLAEKLAASPHDADGWLRLIRSRMVLRQPDLAREALRKAAAEFSGDAVTSEKIAASARELGIAAD